MRTLILLSLCCFLGCVWAENYNVPGEHHSHLQPLVGEWNTKVTFYNADGESHLNGKCVTTLGFDGRFLQERYSNELRGKQFQGVRTTGYDNYKKQYVAFWIDNKSTSIPHSAGTCSKDGKVITLFGENDIPTTGKKQKIKLVTSIKSKDLYTFEFFSQENGKFVRKLLIVHNRVK